MATFMYWNCEQNGWEEFIYIEIHDGQVRRNGVKYTKSLKK